jgi:hypothetical protein
MLRPVIPIMTSNTTPSPFVASFSGTSASGQPYTVFDNNPSTGVSCRSDFGFTVQVTFGKAIRICRYEYIYSYPTQYARTWYFDVLINGTWTQVHSGSTNEVNTLLQYDITPVICEGVRIRWPATSRATKHYLYTLQVYTDDFPDIPEDIIGDHLVYYVSQQNGSDDNDGLSPLTAWATIEKAFMNARANNEGDVRVYIGPGNYELSNCICPICPGIDRNHKIVYQGDPECTYLANDVPGIVLISFKDCPDYYCIDFYGRQFVEIRNINIISTGTNISVISGSEDPTVNVISDVNIYSNTNGVQRITAKNSIVMSKNNCFDKCYAYNCAAIGSNMSNTYAGFLNCTSYNCIAILCTVGYLNNTTYNSEAWLCSSVASGGSATNCLANQCYVTSLPAGWIGTMCCQSSTSVINTSPLVVQKLNLINTLRTGLADWGYNLSAIPDAMIDIDGIVRNSGTADIGPWELADHSLEHDDFYLNKPALKINGHNQIIFDLPVKEGQEITKSVYVKWFEPDTQNIKLNASMTSNAEPAGYTVDSSTNVVGYEPWRVFDSSGTTTYWSASGELPQWISYEFPSDAIVNKYVLSIPTNAQNFSPKDFVLEAWDGSQWVTLDTQSNVVWTSGQTKTFTFSNETVYRKYRLVISSVQSGSVLNIYNFEIWGTLIREQIDNDLKPQLKVEGFGVDQIDSCTADRDIWQKLSVTFTPSKSGVMVVRLISRNPVSGSYAIFSDPQ